MIRKLLLGLLLLAPLAVYPFLRDTGASNPGPDVPLRPSPLTQDEQLAIACFSLMPGQSFPAVLPWRPLYDLSEQRSKKLEDLAKNKPVEFLEYCLARYEKEVHSYRVIFIKHEKVNEKMRPKEKIRVHFSEKPFSVHFNWIEGRGKALRTLYVEGENDGNLLARPFFDKFPIMTARPDGAEAMSTSRFPVTEFGIYKGAKSTLTAIHEAQSKKTLHLKYEGIHRLEQVGGRLCYKLVRTPYDPPEEKESLNELTIFIDQETLMQVGSILKDTEGKLIAEYFFRDVQVNPTFDAKQFTDKAL
ncbi:MAG: DUF1571 domain-containing protein [Gemmataceae bacterium]|nr:DUF1571 domain-containing protein [Gemmataceae bacterium]